MILAVSTLFFFAAVFFSILSLVIRLRPLPLAGALPVALAGVIALEAVLLNLLSLFHLVTRRGVFSAHLLFLSCWLLWIVGRERNFLVRCVQRLSGASRRMLSQPVTVLLLPVVLLCLFLALLYPPNTWDSMTYHMARVAHWMQQQSVAYYPTNIGRQNEMGPGAEYLILFFQILTRTDYLANFVQLFSFCLLPGSLFYILRVFKVSKKLSAPVVLLTITTPMAFMQAVTTQNDLVCTVITQAIIISAVRLFSGAVQRVGRGDYVLLGVCLAAGFLVKPIALIAAAPFFGFGLLLQGKKLIDGDNLRKTISGLVILLITVGVIAGPDILRKVEHQVDRPEVYPLLSGWNTDRLVNPLRITGQNTPWPKRTQAFFDQIGFSGDLLTDNVFKPHQDLIGNPVQLLLLSGLAFITLLALPFVFFHPKKYFSVFCYSVAPLLAWVLFGLIVKNQIWIARLQLPIFFLLPFSFLFIARLLALSPLTLRLSQFFLVAIASFSFLYSFFALTHHQGRPLTMNTFWGEFPSRLAGYYIDRHVKREHDSVLNTARQQQCHRIGLLIDGDTWDYPLTWRIMSAGGETRHVRPRATDDWACILYLGTVKDKNIPKKGLQWLPTEDNHVWIRNLEYEFARSETVCNRAAGEDELARVEPLHAVHITGRNGEAVIRVTGDDPYVQLPSFSCESGYSAVLKLVVSSPEESSAQLFYLTKKNNDFSQDFSIVERLRPGKNILFFFLPVDILTGRLRLDFGSSSGVYTIHSMEVRTIIDDTVTSWR